MPLVRGTCQKDDCDKPHAARGFCSTHYKAWRDGRLREEARAVRERNPRPCKHCGEPIPVIRNAKAIFCTALCKRQYQYQQERASSTPKQAAPCPVDGCGSSVFARGVCAKHYNRLRSKGSLDDTRKNAKGICAIEDCSREHLAGGLCETHYRRARRKEHRRRVTQELAGRACVHCGAELGPDRSARAIFCSRTCKEKERVASGKAAEGSRRHYFGKLYGLTVDQINEMAKAGCAICGTTDWPGRHKRPHVDHDHRTGAVRGVLCSECNTGLGKFRDDPDVLERAIAYLLKAGRAASSQTILA